MCPSNHSKQTVKSTRTILNFLVNSLDGEAALTFAENAELDAEDIYEDLGLDAL